MKTPWIGSANLGLWGLWGLSGLLLGCQSQSPASPTADLVVLEPYVRATPPKVRVTAAFMTLWNRGSVPIKLQSARSPVAESVELHTHLHEDGMAAMKRVDSFSVSPGQKRRLSPGGDHIMLIGLNKTLAGGERVELSLTLDKGEPVTIFSTVRAIAAQDSADHHHH